MPTLIYQSAIVTLDWSTASTTAIILLVVALLVVWGGMAVARRYRYGPDRAVPEPTPAAQGLRGPAGRTVHAARVRGRVGHAAFWIVIWVLGLTGLL